MWKDPIVAETRKLREEYAARFKHDPDAIFEDIRQRQRQPGKKLVSFPARKVGELRMKNGELRP